MMVPLHIKWHRLPRIDTYHQQSNLLKISQITSKELEDFLGTYKIDLKKDVNPVIYPQ